MSNRRLLVESINLSHTRWSWFNGQGEALGLTMANWVADGPHRPHLTVVGDPGLSTGQLLELVNQSHCERVIVWTRGSARLGLTCVNDPLNATALAHALSQVGLRPRGAPLTWPPVPLTLPSQLG